MNIRLKRIVLIILILLGTIGVKSKVLAVSNVIEIGTAEEMWNFAKDVNNGNTYEGKTIKLTNNINLNCSEEKPWYPIGSINKSIFSGNFDGQGYTISNLYINNKTSKYSNNAYYVNVVGTGLFGVVINGNIKNLNINNSKIVLSNFAGEVGLVVGATMADDDKKSNIENCKASNSKITLTQNINNYETNVGGIVGCARNKGCLISDCTNVSNSIEIINNKDISSETVGGIVGISYGKVNRCYNNQKISVTGAAFYIGGIVGASENLCQYCINKGEIAFTPLKLNRESCVGGIAGTSYNVKNVYNLGKINIIKNQANSNKGTFSIGCVGGIIGDGVFVQYAYNKGNIQIDNIFSVIVGGIAGTDKHYNNFDNCLKLYYCYNTGNVPKPSDAYYGGLIGLSWVKTLVVSKCYYTNSMYGIYAYQSGDKYYWNPASQYQHTSGFVDKGTKVTLAELQNKNFISKINGSQSVFQIDKYKENNGTPIIVWETGISINTIPTKKDYEKQVETLNLSGGKINILHNYSKHNKILAMTDKNVKVTLFNNEKQGTNRLQCQYNSFVNYFNVNIIDTVAPVLKITFDPQTVTNKDVTAKITANEEIQPINGWTISNDKKVLTKSYDNNVTNEEIQVKDIAGNVTKQMITINNIDKIGPKINVKYSSTKKTNKNVKVTLTTDEEVGEVEGWTLSEDKKTLTKTYKKNTTETVSLKDLLGNETKQTIKISNIDKTVPTVTITYSSIEKTNQNVTVNLTANEEIQEVEGWTLSSDKKVLTKQYTQNIENEEIIIKDIAGNETKQAITINNIDKVAPKVTVKYSTTEKTNQNVTITVIANEAIQAVSGWTLSQDKKQLSKIYSNNTTETITIKDLVGNETKQTITINNIDKTPEQVKKVGDVNESNKIDIGDILLLKRQMAYTNSTIVANKHTDWKLSDEKTTIGDINKNGKIDIGDILKLQRYISASNSKQVAEKHKDWLNLQ